MNENQTQQPVFLMPDCNSTGQERLMLLPLHLIKKNKANLNLKKKRMRITFRMTSEKVEKLVKSLISRVNVERV